MDFNRIVSRICCWYLFILDILFLCCLDFFLHFGLQVFDKSKTAALCCTLWITFWRNGPILIILPIIHIFIEFDLERFVIFLIIIAILWPSIVNIQMLLELRRRHHSLLSDFHIWSLDFSSFDERSLDCVYLDESSLWMHPIVDSWSVVSSSRIFRLHRWIARKWVTKSFCQPTISLNLLDVTIIDLLDLIFGNWREFVLRIHKMWNFTPRMSYCDCIFSLRWLLVLRVAKVFHHHEKFVMLRQIFTRFVTKFWLVFTFLEGFWRNRPFIGNVEYTPTSCITRLRL